MNAEEIMDWYLAHNAKELRKISDQILKSKMSGAWARLGLSQKDEDDFYSIANMVLWDVSKKWDGKRDFRGLLWSALSNKFASEFRFRNQQKREKDRELLSFDAMLTEDGGNLEEIVDSGFSIERELQNSTDDPSKMGKEIQSYWKGLSKRQKRLLMLQVDGFSASEIKEQMQLKEKEYQRLQGSLRSYEHASKLYGYMDNNLGTEKEGEKTMKTEESRKIDPVVIKSVIRRVREQAWRRDHPLQRPSGLWTPTTKSEFISDILHHEIMPQIVVDEEMLEDGPIYWIVEGNQRCSLLDQFAADEFKLSNLITHATLEYKSATEFKKNKAGITVPVIKTCDLRGKSFSQLPREVQEMFFDFPYPTAMSLNCNAEDVAYDIVRYNRAKPMTKAQVGWTEMEPNLASDINNLIENVDFFNPESNLNGFKGASGKNGSIRRIIVETLMVMNFPDEYSRSLEKNCRLLSQYASNGMIPNFYTLVNELQEVLTPDVADLFTISGSVFWLTLFRRFKDLEVDGARISNCRFVDFLREFKSRLYIREVDGVSWDSLGTKNDRQRWGVQKKMNLLLHLMWEYFGVIPPKESEPEEILHNEPVVETQNRELEETNTAVEKNEPENGEEKGEVIEAFTAQKIEPVDTKKLCEEVVQDEVLDEDIETWRDCLLDSVKNVGIDPNVPILDETNMPSLIALMAWIFKQDKDGMFDEWLADYSKRTNGYKANQAENFREMRNDFIFFEADNTRKEAS